MVDGEELAQLKRDYTGYTYGLVRLNPGRWIFPSDFMKFADKLYNFKFKANDVLIMTYMKCGTTWMQEMVWTMRNNSNLDHAATDDAINSRVPFLECDMFLGSTAVPPPDPDSSLSKEFAQLCPGKNPEDGFFLQMADAIPEPRTIKTHLPLSLFPPELLDTVKIVYVARDPGDVAVSYYHHAMLFKSIGYMGSFESFISNFMDDNLLYGPYWLHVKEAWEKRNHPNLHFVFYEDLKADIMGELKKLDTFLGTNVNPHQIEKIKDFTRFEKMQERGNVFTRTGESDPYTIPMIENQHGGFFRKGKSGGWRERMNDNQVKLMEEWTTRRFTCNGITFNSPRLE
ncbi:hypothetical protein Pmani_004264 [Petrolisthes manimaculis]|uniref:Sulfotransferase domain-containing protein n=1 Tax=Petrolisthes manimaculis TaxID=1843537 RepID=A0AAE1QEJ8_9EUCA|nr:hypothetical protein Pmani_004264 [Petrolisthes manimaculis]